MTTRFTLFLMVLTANAVYSSQDISYEPLHIVRALNRAWLLPGVVFENIRQASSTIAQAFRDLWSALANVWPSASPHDSATTHIVDRQLTTIIEKTQDIEQTCQHALLDEHLSSLERSTLEILQNTTHKTLLVDSIAGGAGTAILWWLYHDYEELIVQKMPTRFVGIGLGTVAALKGASAILIPLLKITGILIIGCYVRYKIKEAIIAPYREKHKEEIEKFKEALQQHKITVAQEQQETARKLDEALSNLMKEVNEKIKETHQKNVALHKDVEAQIVGLSTATAHLEEKHQALHSVVSTHTSALQGQLSAISSDLKSTQEQTREIKHITESALPALTKALTIIREIKTKNEAALTSLQQPAPLPQPAATPSSAKGGSKWFKKK